MHIIYHFSCANNSYINEHIHKQTHVEAHTRTQKCGRKNKKGKKQNSLGGLEVGGDGVEVVAEARGDTHARHHHALQAVDHLDLRAGRSSFRQCCRVAGRVARWIWPYQAPFPSSLKTNTFPRKHMASMARSCAFTKRRKGSYRDGGAARTGLRGHGKGGLGVDGGIVAGAKAGGAQRGGRKAVDVEARSQRQHLHNHRRKLCHREPRPCPSRKSAESKCKEH